jgi:hypothetical protein
MTSTGPVPPCSPGATGSREAIQTSLRSGVEPLNRAFLPFAAFVQVVGPRLGVCIPHTRHLLAGVFHQRRVESAPGQLVQQPYLCYLAATSIGRPGRGANRGRTPAGRGSPNQSSCRQARQPAWCLRAIGKSGCPPGPTPPAQPWKVTPYRTQGGPAGHRALVLAEPRLPPRSSGYGKPRQGRLTASLTRPRSARPLTQPATPGPGQRSRGRQDTGARLQTPGNLSRHRFDGLLHRAADTGKCASRCGVAERVVGRAGMADGVAGAPAVRLVMYWQPYLAGHPTGWLIYSG